MQKKRNEKLPHISIIMPSFNGAKYIERAINSVIEQDYPDFELFIKDGGSSDDTIKIIKQYAKKYPGKIRWVSEKDEGQTDAINFGIKKVKGEVLAYLNSDDLYKPGAFKVVGEYFKNNQQKMWLAGKCDIINERGREIRKWITLYKNFWLGLYSYNLLLTINFFPQTSVFWRREAAAKIGLFDKVQYYVMDYDYWLRLGKLYRPGIIDKYLASFRAIESSKSSTGFTDQFEDEYKVAKKYTQNRLILFLHLLHIKLVILTYKLMALLKGRINQK